MASSYSSYDRGSTLSRTNTTFSKDRENAEKELSLSVKKAVNPDETAPKQKHVRAAIVFTWDWKTSVPFWTALRLNPVFADEVQCFKALIMIHKVIRGGHPVVLKETLREVPFLDACSRQMRHDTFRGYSTLIVTYVEFLKAKLDFHKIHPEFNGTFDYEEYLSLKRVDDPNEGYQTIAELMQLQDKVDVFQKQVFSNFRTSSHNECRIASLVPLVEESYGIYKFITSMLTAMHASRDLHEPLQPLRERYNKQYYMLLKFYFECSNLKYLTSLISVPKLPPHPPDFTDVAGKPPPAQPVTPREHTPPPQDDVDLWGSTAENPEPQWQLTNPFEQQQQMILQQQMVQTSQYESELGQLRAQQAQAQQLLSGYEGRMMEMEQRVRDYENRCAEYEQRLMSQSSFDVDKERRDRERDDLIRSLQEQVAMWKSKYENIAKMYAQLRKEHLDLLNKYKEIQKQAVGAKEAVAEKEKYVTMMRTKNSEVAELTKDKDHWKNEFEKAQMVNGEEMARLKRATTEAQQRFEELSKSKGAETQNLVAKFNAEKAEAEARARATQEESDKLRNEMRDLRSEMERARLEAMQKNEEIAILQAGMDQSLMALTQLQQRGSDTEADLLSKFDNMQLEHRSQMDKIMDSVLEDCKVKVDDAVFEVDSAAHPGNQTATPEYVLTMIEKLAATSNDFAASFTKHLIGGDTSGDFQADAIKSANNLSQATALLLHNAKGITRLAADDKVIEDILNAAKSAAHCGKSFFNSMQSAQLSTIEFQQRPNRVSQCNAEFQSSLQPIGKLAEQLVPKEVGEAIAGEDDLGDFVEQELSAAAKAIADAAAHIASLMGENRPRDPKLTQLDLQVHDAILASAKSITDAIGRLIICATNAQQEIVASGRGSGSKTAFYKKNSRWTEGLISAAKAVATATKTLVECADGVVHGTHKMEQLVVAAHEVAAAVAQLVAASRVKAIRGSKTQDKLEGAAKAVAEATKLLVNAAEMARNSKQETNGRDVDYSKLTPHEFKKREMEQQVQILTLEKNLNDARKMLADMRRSGYHREADYGT